MLLVVVEGEEADLFQQKLLPAHPTKGVALWSGRRGQRTGQRGAGKAGVGRDERGGEETADKLRVLVGEMAESQAGLDRSKGRYSQSV